MDNRQKALFKFNAMVGKLDHLGTQQDKIKVLKANFDTGDILITFVNQCQLTYEAIMQRIKFVEMTPRLLVREVDFETGVLTIQMLEHDKDIGLTDEEYDFVKRGMIINAIKSVRARLNLGLADAKHYVEDARDQLIKSGVI